jgi:hypothetical protein
VADPAAGRPPVRPVPLRLPRPTALPDLLWSAADWQRIRSGWGADGRLLRYTAEGVLFVHHRATGHGLLEVRVEALRHGARRPVSAVREAHAGHCGGEPTVPTAELLRSL